MVHILERAVHDQGLWSMDLCGVRVQAQRAIEEDRVVFSAEFPEMGIIEDTTFPMSLYCREDLVLVRNVPFADRAADESFTIEWTLSLPAGVAA
jgi:hypothetical protein